MLLQVLKKMKKMNNYWIDRINKIQDRVRNKQEKEIERQIKKYYQNAMNKVIEDFENTYNALLTKQNENKEIAIANLYKLDKYWRMQGQLKKELEKLGDKQAKLLSKKFETTFFEVYNSLNILGDFEFTRIDREGAIKLINAIWCADGLDYSQRIWKNTNKLVNRLNDGLVHCVITGKKTSELKKTLREEFSVSYSQANRIVQTEMSHIQNTAARQRYADMGVKEFQVWAKKDERRCPICGSLHKKIYSINENSPIPAHPRCRCTIIPVVDLTNLKTIKRK